MWLLNHTEEGQQARSDSHHSADQAENHYLVGSGKYTPADKALLPLVEAATTTLQLDEAKRVRTIIRVDAGSGTQDGLNWLLARGYEIMAKEYSGRSVVRLAKTVTEWVQDPDWSERSFGWGSSSLPGESASLCVVSDKMAPSLDAYPDLFVVGSARFLRCSSVRVRKPLNPQRSWLFM
jgi:hypothetical protein